MHFYFYRSTGVATTVLFPAVPLGGEMKRYSNTVLGRY